MNFPRPAVFAALILGLMCGLAACTAENHAPSGTSEQAAGETFTRDQVAAVIANGRRIVTPDGVEETLEIPVAGTRQWITVRGRDRDNPVLLVIHGGPASPEMPASWAFQNGWEDYFTVVQWDQRGSGKTYNANDPEKIAPTLSLDRITEDAALVVDYLRQRYGKEKVFVMGHSWGSLVGLSLAHRHPDRLHAYIGMGQVINGQENERLSHAHALQAARQAGNAVAVEELESLLPYPEPDGTVPLEKIDTERKWSVRYGGLTYGRDSIDYYFQLAKFSPDYTADDYAAIGKGSALSLPRLLPDLAGFNFSDVTAFDCPVILFEGRHDYTTPSVIAAEWLERVDAPATKLVWFENSAHMMMLEEPGRVLVHLVNDVRPLADSQL